MLRPFLVGIAGGSGSGKTTLTQLLATRLGSRCSVVQHDAYYRQLAHLPPQERAMVNFDHPDSLDNELLVAHLELLRGGTAIEQPEYDFTTHTRRAKTTSIAARPIVLVEGILVLSLQKLRQVLDLKVFVDAAADVRALRRARRDVEERGRTLNSVFDQWFATVRPMHDRFVDPARVFADVRIDGEDLKRRGVERIMMELQKYRGEQSVAAMSTQRTLMSDETSA
ncbi:MAG: uridine kinase [Planctomycetes bacterium]|nr:uridine kinase [Planctomycetota bacterium]